MALQLGIHQLRTEILRGPKEFGNSVSRKRFLRSSSRLGIFIDLFHINLQADSHALRQEQSRLSEIARYESASEASR